ncbi:MAG: VWA domain-containing protein [Tepidisphaeraceae bacterium]
MAIVPIVLASLRRGAASAPAGPLHIATVLFRLAALALGVIALAQPMLWIGTNRPLRVAVVDLSPSVSADALAKAEEELRGVKDELRVIAITGDACVVDPQQATASGRLSQLRTQLPRPTTGPSVLGQSALADGIRLAAAQIADTRAGQITLFSDGWETSGDARAVVRELAERGIEVVGVPLDPMSRPVTIVSIHTPSNVGIGETATVSLEVESDAARDARVTLRTGADAAAVERAVTLKPGRQTIVLPVAMNAAGGRRLVAELRPADHLSDGDAVSRAETSLFVNRSLNVVVIEPDEDAARAAGAFTRLLGPSAVVTSAKASELETLSLDHADAVVLADVPGDRLPPAFQQRLTDAVSAGTGLLVAAGPRSLGPGGYASQPIRHVLPVRMPQELEKDDPSATLVIVIDSSGSMSGPRMALAKEVARLAIRRLQPHDKAGIVEFYGTRRWAAPIQPASNTLDLNRALDRLAASGGTVILPALEEAFFALKNVRTRTRHILVLTDGGVETGPFETVVRRMADNGMTVSTVLVGPGQHSEFLSNLAEWGNGRFYQAPNHFNVPEVIVKQPQTNVVPPFVETPSMLSTPTSARSAWTASIDWTTLPPIEGYLRVEAKPSAEVLVQSERGDPVVTQWRWAAGRVAVLSTAPGTAWVQQLVAQPAGSAFVSSLVRSVAPTALSDISVAAEHSPAGLAVTLSARPGASMPAEAIDVRLAGAQAGSKVTRRVDSDSSSRSTYTFADLPSDTYAVQVNDASGKSIATGSAVVPTPREFVSLRPNESFFEDLSEISQRARANAGSRAAPGRYADVTPYCAAASLVSLLLTVLLRRWPAGRTLAMSRSVLVAAIVLVSLFADGNISFAQTAAPSTGPATTQPIVTDEMVRPENVRQTTRRWIADGLPLEPLRDRVASLAAVEAEYLPALADLSAEMGDLAGAMNAAEAFAKLHPQAGPAWAKLAAYAELAGDEAKTLTATDLALTDAALPEADRVLLATHRALLLLDRNDSTAGAALETLSQLQAVGDQTSPAMRATMLASLAGRFDLAIGQASALPASEAGTFAAMLRGSALLGAGRAREAQVAFEAALPGFTLTRERRYTYDRITAAAREAGTLKELADTWLADEAAPADRLLPLVAVLRELGRTDDALRILREPKFETIYGEVVHSPAIQREIIAAAAEAGRIDEAIAAYDRLSKLEPDNDDWLASRARLTLSTGQTSAEAEVDAMLRAALQSRTDAGRLRSLLGVAQQLGRHEVVRDAGQRLTDLADESARFDGWLTLAQAARRAGDPSALARAQTHLAELVGSDTRRALLVADLIEQSGDRRGAIDLLRSASAKGGSGVETVLARLAKVLERDGKSADAMAVWRRLWETSNSPGQQRSAMERLLELAAKTSTLVDLATEMEEQLGAGKAGVRELSLLVEIYTDAGDVQSAAEILSSFKSRLGGEASMLRQLAELYQRNQRFGQADRTLKKLLNAEPQSAIDTLQRLAVLALERRRPADAQWALEELTRRAGADSSLPELRAGVFDRLGMTAAAAVEYRRAIAANEQRVEDWLLWAQSAAAAGQGEQAVNRLLLLASQAENDDLFVAAVDGLMNLQAPRPALRTALRLTVGRIAAAPQRLTLYTLAADLSDAAGDGKRGIPIGDVSLLVAGEQRPIVVRDLIALCRATGNLDQARRFGSTLVALGDEAPPQVMLELGQILLESNRITDADRCFARAKEAGDPEDVLRRTVDLYEQAGQLRLAVLASDELLRIQNDDVALRVRVASLHEQAGANDLAAAQYEQALVTLLRRRPDSSSDAATRASSRPSRPPGRCRPIRGSASARRRRCRSSSSRTTPPSKV